MVNDPVADFITRLRNAALRQAETVTVPANRLTAAIGEALVRARYVTHVDRRDGGTGQPVLVISFRYVNGLNAIHSIRQLSKRSLRRYSSYKTLRSPQRGSGILILSTPLGVLSDREARTKGVGGELLCEIHS